jgi:hypothetical protein
VGILTLRSPKSGGALLYVRPIWSAAAMIYRIKHLYVAHALRSLLLKLIHRVFFFLRKIMPWGVVSLDL